MSRSATRSTRSAASTGGAARAGFYLDRDELSQSIDEILPSALRQASLEAFEGRRDDVELRAMLDIDGLKQETLAMIATDASGQGSTGR